MHIFLLTALTMAAFAANSILGRLALGATSIDPASYTLIRLLSGAMVLALLANLGGKQRAARAGNWVSAAALFAYAAAFSFAYLKLPAGTGALVLFTSVQGTMIAWGLYRGDRPSAGEWSGQIIAFLAFVWLVSPGVAAPDFMSSVLMALAGVSWGVYSIRGRSSGDPLQATAGNFLRSVPFALALCAVFIPQMSVPLKGVALAVASGAVTSGLGYALWYRVLAKLTSIQAALVQLTVPAIATAGGIAFMGEPLTARFAACSCLIISGIALSIVAKAKSRPPPKA
jgi:drug/metabolite transporter (DMT)-like permease